MATSEGEENIDDGDVYPPLDVVLDCLCASCRRFPQSPKLLSCLHTMCESCAEQCVRPTQRVIRCPTCNHDTPLPSAGLIRALPTNALPFYQREGKLQPSPSSDSHSQSAEKLCEECVEDEAQLAVANCNECRLLLCVIHAQGHRKSRRTAHHTITEDIDKVSMSIVQSRVHCALHPGQDPCCYCKECGKLICSRCLENGEHDHHCTLAISEVGVQERQALVERSAALRGHLRSTKVAERATRKAIETCDEKAEDASSQIEEVFNSLRRALDEEERRLLDDVDALRQKTMTPLEEQEADLSAESKRLTSAVLFTDICTKTMTDVELLELSGTVSVALDRATNRRRPIVVPSPPLLLFHSGDVDKLKANVRKGVGCVNVFSLASHSVHVLASPPPYFRGAAVNIDVDYQEAAENRACLPDGAHIKVSVQEPDGCNRSVACVKVSAKQDSDNLCHVRFSPSKLGKHLVSVVLCGQHVEGSPLAIGCVEGSPLAIKVTQYPLRFEAQKCEQRSMKISADGHTVACVSEPGCCDIICGPGFTTGCYEWTVKMNDFHHQAGQLTGIATVRDADYSAPYRHVHYKFGFTRRGAKPIINSKPGKRCGVTGSLPKWERGDSVKFHLDCDDRVLTATHLQSNSVEQITDIPCGETYYAYFNLFLPPTSVTLVDDIN